MQYTTHSQIGAAAQLPIGDESPVITYSPVVLPSPNRLADLHLKVSAPAIGNALPIILLSHGHGPSAWLPSLHGCAPLASFYAGHGFVVLQPTHLNTRTLTLEHKEGHEMGWDSRPLDMIQIIDDLETIETTVPGLKGRLDKTRIAVVGHSFGAFTALMLLGTSNTDPRNGSKVRNYEKRIRAGVVLGGSGSSDALSETGKKIVPFYGPDFNDMASPALIVCGEEDDTPYCTGGPQWHADPYTLAPGQKHLMWVKGGKHGFGGVSGWDAAECDDGSPERLGFVQRMTWAYLRTQLYEDDDSWTKACKALDGLSDLGRVETKDEQ
ncbi:hypothetical protein HJFPF1_06072 [Paramyrothecium foliicola]|nr:hypothetical protein HJFPF1_06072 [Paramyrothecium foliicola]